MESQSSSTINRSEFKVKMFQMSQKYFAILGINPNLIDQAYRVNWKISIGFSMLGIGLICNLLFIFCEAKTFWEFSESTYICCGLILGTSAMAFLVLRVELLFELIGNFEDAINTSEYIKIRF